MTLGGTTSDIFSVRFDPESKYVAAGYGNGIINIFNISTYKLSYTLTMSSIKEEDRLPVTALRWKPLSYGGKSLYILTSVCADGSICVWHSTSQKMLHNHKTPLGSDLYALDYSQDGSAYAVAGKNYAVFIYDDATQKLKRELKTEAIDLVGHSNRIHSLKFAEDQNLLLSGSWDSTVKIWDMRSRIIISRKSCRNTPGTTYLWRRRGQQRRYGTHW